MALAQGPIRRVAHHQKSGTAFNTKIEGLHNMRMLQVSKGVGLGEKPCRILPVEIPIDYLNSHRHVIDKMLAQIDFRKAILPQQANQAIHAQLLTYTTS